MTTAFKVTEAFGTETEIARLTDEAMGMAQASGSVGATCKESTWDSDKAIKVVTALVTVSRI